MDEEQYNAIMAERGLKVRSSKDNNIQELRNESANIIKQQKENLLYELMEKEMVLDTQGLNNLKTMVDSFYAEKGKLPDVYDVIQFVYTEAFRAGVQESINILQKGV
jgi:hypothetical protein